MHWFFEHRAGGKHGTGAGLWGQLDLTGNVSQWNLDWYATYGSCTDCVYLTNTGDRVVRGSSYANSPSFMTPSFRYHEVPFGRLSNFGFRCARMP